MSAETTIKTIIARHSITPDRRHTKNADMVYGILRENHEKLSRDGWIAIKFGGQNYGLRAREVSSGILSVFPADVSDDNLKQAGMGVLVYVHRLVGDSEKDTRFALQPLRKVAYRVAELNKA